MCDIYKKATEIIEKLEKDCDVYELTVNSIPIWWFIRIRFYEELLNRLDKKEKVNLNFDNGLKLNKPIELRFKSVALFLFKSAKSAIDILILRMKIQKPALFLITPVNLTEQKNIDIYTEEIYSKMRNKAIVISKSTLGNRSFFSFLDYQNILFFDLLLLMGAFKLLLRFELFNKKGIKGWGNFEKRCKQVNFGEISSEELLKLAKELILSCRRKVFIQLEAAEIILNKVKPKIVIETTSYDSGVVALNFAAKKRNIRIIELQHGFITKDYPSYNHFISKDYTMLQPLPDKIFLFGQSAKKEILVRGNAFRDDRLVITGFPRLNNFLNGLEINRNDIRKKIRIKLGIKEDEFLVTIADQSGGYISAFVEKLLPLLTVGIVIVVKIHPNMTGEIKDIYKNILTSSLVRVVTGKDANLYELIAASDTSATVYSTTLIESMALGIPGIIIGGPGYEILLKIIGANNIKLAESPKEFMNIIKKIKDNSVYKADIVAKGLKRAVYFFDPNPYLFDRAIEQEIMKYI